MKTKEHDVSNTTLAILVGVGILISVAGVYLASAPRTSLAGAAVSNVTTATGSASFAVRGNLIIALADATVNLGTVEIGENKTSVQAADFFTVRNDGSVDLNLFVYGVTSPFSSSTANTLPTSYFQIRVNSTESGTVNETMLSNASYFDIPAGLSTKQHLITGLDQANAFDEALIDLKIRVPDDEAAGSKAADVIFFAAAS